MSAPRAVLSAAGLDRHASTVSGAPREVTAGLWVWRVSHPNWTPGSGWSAVVNSTCVESGGEIVLVDPPRTDLEPIYPGSELPVGLVALHDGRGRNETPLWLPEQTALVFADALTAPDGELRVWSTPWHEQRTLPALRALPFVHVFVAHGEPVHERSAFELPPWTEEGTG